jgi:hypothetical protein
MKQLTVICLACTLMSSPVFGWGDQGHDAIWIVAQSRLTPAAKGKVDQILAGDKLDLTSTWMDKARDALKHHNGPLAHDAETAQFNTSFPSNDLWHYVNLPLGASSYAEGQQFTSENDVVHALNLSLGCLEGTCNELSKRIALRAVVHLVGDIHQPLHCGTGYYDVSNPDAPRLLESPAEAFPQIKIEDRGGNQLYYGPSSELHAFWDADLVKVVAGNVSSAQSLADKLSADLGSVNADTPGDFHTWPESWASESIVLAHGAYQGIQLGHRTLKNDGTIAKIQIVKPADYTQEQSPVVKAQLSKAALRLATLLNLVLDQPTPVPSATPTPSPQPSPTSTQWEYQMISAANATDLLNQANTQGTQGWELSGVAVDTSRPDKYVGFLKRKRP